MNYYFLKLKLKNTGFHRLGVVLTILTFIILLFTLNDGGAPLIYSMFDAFFEQPVEVTIVLVLIFLLSCLSYFALKIGEWIYEGFTEKK